jgi:hypothetical protein
MARAGEEPRIQKGGFEFSRDRLRLCLLLLFPQRGEVFKQKRISRVREGCGSADRQPAANSCSPLFSSYFLLGDFVPRSRDGSLKERKGRERESE